MRQCTTFKSIVYLAVILHEGPTGHALDVAAAVTPQLNPLARQPAVKLAVVKDLEREEAGLGHACSLSNCVCL